MLSLVRDLGLTSCLSLTPVRLTSRLVDEEAACLVLVVGWSLALTPNRLETWLDPDTGLTSETAPVLGIPSFALTVSLLESRPGDDADFEMNWEGLESDVTGPESLSFALTTFILSEDILLVVVDSLPVTEEVDKCILDVEERDCILEAEESERILEVEESERILDVEIAAWGLLRVLRTFTVLGFEMSTATLFVFAAVAVVVEEGGEVCESVRAGLGLAASWWPSREKTDIEGVSTCLSLPSFWLGKRPVLIMYVVDTSEDDELEMAIATVTNSRSLAL